jgi:hypothetical protein
MANLCFNYATIFSFSLPPTYSIELPSDKETLQAMVLELQAGRDQGKKRAEELQVENLRL